MQVSCMLDFFFDLRFMVFTGGEGRSDLTLIEWDSDVDVLVALFPKPSFW